MTGLVGYGSSDEEDFVNEDQPTQLKSGVKVWPNIRLYWSVTYWIDLRPHETGSIGLTRPKTVA